MFLIAPKSKICRRVRATALFLAAVTSVVAVCAASGDDEFDVRIRVIRGLVTSGDYAGAESKARQLVADAESASDKLAVTRATGLLVEALVRNGRGVEASTRTLAETVLKSLESGTGSGPEAISPALRLLGDVLIEAGDYPGAAARFRQAFDHLQGAGGAKSREAAWDLDGLARALTRVEQFDQALQATQNALALKQDLLGSDDADLADTLDIRAQIWQHKGEYKQARSDLERAFGIRESKQQNHPETAATLALLARQCWHESDLLGAREFSRRAVAIAESTLRPDHPHLGSYLKSLAFSLQDVGDLVAARDLRERALAVAERTYGAQHQEVAGRMSDLASTLFLQGEYAASRSLYERALSVYDRVAPDHADAATVAYNIANLNATLGDILEARRYFQRAIRSWEKGLDARHPVLAWALSSFAETLAERGLDREAKPLYERALSIRERSLVKDHPYTARTLAYLAVTLARLGETRRATELSERALRIWEVAGSADPAGFADSLMMGAMIQERRHDWMTARRSFERALDIRMPMFGPNHPAVAEARAGLAASLAVLGQTREAAREAMQAEEIGRAHLRLTLADLPERQALEYAAKRPRGLDLAMSLVAKSDGGRASFDAVVRGRSLILDEMASRQRLIWQRNVDGAAEPLWSELAATRQRLANLVIRGPAGQRPEQYAALVENARQEKELAERALAAKSTTFRPEAARQEIGIEQVQAQLPQDSALVSFLKYSRSTFKVTSGAGGAGASAEPRRSRQIVTSYVAFVLRPQVAEPIVVPLGSAASLETVVADWRQAMMTDVISPADNGHSGPSFAALGNMLRQRIWAPLAPHLINVRRVFVVPDGALNLVPLAALPSARGRYLLDDGPVIHYLSAERDLVPTEVPSGKSGRGLLAAGGPAFADGAVFASLSGNRPPTRASEAAGTNVAPPTTPSTASAVTGFFRSAGSKCASFQSIQFHSLPGSRREAEDVARLWQTLRPERAETERADDDQVLIGRAASEQAIKELAPGRRILHLATHGFFLGDQCASALDNTRAVGGLVVSPQSRPAAPGRTRAQPLPESPLLLSGLAMAGANRRAAAGPDEDDGILTAEEVASLNLQGTEWAVLSACGTGLGAIKAGEGVFGLRRAFQIAGARTVIMSLWSVNDRATRTWMHALYEGRLNKHLDTADAMREASLTVLHNRRAAKQSTHPFYWAAFVAAGDWR
jgi:CHAT domain-containing protein